MTRMKIPNSAGNKPSEKQLEGAIIINPYSGKEMLTFSEALDAINMLSAMTVVVNHQGRE